MWLINIVMSLLVVTVLIALWIIMLYQVDDVIFKGFFLKKIRARFGVDQQDE